MSGTKRPGSASCTETATSPTSRGSTSRRPARVTASAPTSCVWLCPCTFLGSPLLSLKPAAQDLLSCLISASVLTVLLSSLSSHSTGLPLIRACDHTGFTQVIQKYPSISKSSTYSHLQSLFVLWLHRVLVVVFEIFVAEYRLFSCGTWGPCPVSREALHLREGEDWQVGRLQSWDRRVRPRLV